jgi:hypothetical protein
LAYLYLPKTAADISMMIHRHICLFEGSRKKAIVRMFFSASEKPLLDFSDASTATPILNIEPRYKDARVVPFKKLAECFIKRSRRTRKSKDVQIMGVRRSKFAGDQGIEMCRLVTSMTCIFEEKV